MADFGGGGGCRPAAGDRGGGGPGANLTKANVARAGFEETDFIDANLTGVSGNNTDFNGTDFTGADLTAVKLPGGDFPGANFTSAILARADLDHSNLGGVIAAKADFAGANLTSDRLNAASFSGASLKAANLAHVALAGLNLAGANLSGVFAVNDSFAHANVTKASLANADLASADFAGANLSGASLKGADLAGAELTATNASLKNVAWSAATTCPNGHLASAKTGCFAKPAVARPPGITLSVRRGVRGIRQGPADRRQRDHRQDAVDLEEARKLGLREGRSARPAEPAGGGQRRRVPERRGPGPRGDRLRQAAVAVRAANRHLRRGARAQPVAAHSRRRRAVHRAGRHRLVRRPGDRHRDRGDRTGGRRELRPAGCRRWHRLPALRRREPLRVQCAGARAPVDVCGHRYTADWPHGGQRRHRLRDDDFPERGSGRRDQHQHARPKWSFKAPAALNAPAIAGGVVHTLNANGAAYAFNAKTAAQLWSYQAGNTLRAIPVIANGIVYIGTRSGGVEAFAAR